MIVLFNAELIFQKFKKSPVLKQTQGFLSKITSYSHEIFRTHQAMLLQFHGVTS